MKLLFVFVAFFVVLVNALFIVPWTLSLMPLEMKEALGEISLPKVEFRISPEAQRSVLFVLFIYVVAQVAVLLHELTFHREKKE